MIKKSRFISMMCILATSACVLVSLSACDKLNFGAPKKSSSKSGRQSAVVHGTVVAKVNSISITLEDLNQDIAAINKMIEQQGGQEKISTKEDKVAYLKNDLVRRALLYQEALDRGLDTKPDMVSNLENVKMQLLVTQLLSDEMGKMDVSSKEIEDFYNTNQDLMKEPEERQIREIFVNTEDEARGLLIQLLQGADFATIAKDVSKSQSAKNGGDLGFIKKGMKSAQFDAVAFSDTLEVGKVSSVFKAPDGFYIVKLEAKRGGKPKGLSELWDGIKKLLLEQKQQQKLDELTTKLLKNAKVEIYEQEIK